MKALPGILFIAVLIAVGISSSAYTINEVEQVIITKFGQPVGEAVKEPGLHWRVPFIHKINRFDKRWLEWDGDADEMPTKEKTYIWVDVYARWRIDDPLKFFTSAKGERRAQSLLDDIIGSATRNVIAAHDLIEVVRTSNREFEVQGELDSQEADKNSATKISVGREKLTRMILEKAREATPDFGIELRDIQLQRVNYTESVKLNNFRRMKAERQKFSDNYRAEGDAAASRINGKRSQELKTIQSEAYLQVQKIKGEADALATGIYAEAYNLDPQFYEFIKSLESYRTTIREGDTLVLSSDSDYLKHMAKYQ
ncbi:MAG: protease modulator HflC [Myxococcota bacterium]|nr:protease modulator HflC [Myxococcota bacterium]